MIVGITGCIAAPLAAYWIGDAALPLVFVFSFIAEQLVSSAQVQLTVVQSPI